ncbi:hypothetical protein ACFQMA_06675 [Halosimplex aquaticum]|uniref:Uncharacterized protein n=1 Tax=Halosimplex aquaticum TaxID=3026162 RepID=A0ABD5XZW2_9EURY|nr:hypothetical protein [Halosimplex aquaticum]
MSSRTSEFAPSLERLDITLPNVGQSVVTPITGVAFWAAVALPFLHLPLLVATGLSSEPYTNAFIALLVANVIALLVGHSHYRD